MSAVAPIPVVLFGLMKEIGIPVSKALKPEYEVIHFFDNLSQGLADLPLLLQSKTPAKPTAEGVGSGNYSRPPEAILFGKAWANEDVDRLRSVSVGVGGAKGVPWLKAGTDQAGSSKILSGEVPRPSPEQYAPVVAQKVKDLLAEIESEGKWGSDGVYIW